MFIGNYPTLNIKMKAFNDPVEITNMGVTGDTAFTIEDNFSYPVLINTGDSLIMHIKFTPAIVRDYSGAVNIYNNSNNNPKSINLSGIGLAPLAGTLTASLDTVNFGSRRLGDSLDIPVVFKAESGNVAVSQIVQGNGGAVDFKVTGVTPGVPDTLEPGADSLVVIMRFKPLSAGNKKDTLKIYSNAINRSEYLVFLSGTATINQAPNAFALKSPVVMALINDRTPAFTWEGKGDPDGDTLKYILEVSKVFNFSSIAYLDSTTADTALTAAAQLDSLGSYYWRVTAKDPWGGARTSDIGFFRIDAVPADLTMGTFFSAVTKQYVSVNVISNKLMQNVQGKIVLRNASHVQLDSVVKALDLESAANKFYQTPYKLINAGNLFMTVTGTDSAQNITTVTKSYSVGSIAKDQALAISSEDNRWQITSPKRTVTEDGYLMVSVIRDESKSVLGQTVMAMAKAAEGWTMIGEGLDMLGSVSIREGQGFMVTLKYDETTIGHLQSRYNDYDERKIGLYAERGSEWVYTGGEGKNGQVQAKVKEYGKVRMMYNPEHEFLPTKLELAQNYPNPFNPTTTIRFGVPQEGKVKLVIYNVLGQKVKELVNDNRSAGYYNIIWNGRSDIGHIVSSGVYLYRIETPQGAAVKKMIMVK